MTSGAPWSVKGIDPKAREVAKDLARRSGMTLGDWLNSMILEEEGPEEIGSETYFTDPPRVFADASGRSYYETPRHEPIKPFVTPMRPEPLRDSPSRFEAPEHPADEIGRVTLALDRLTDRIESSEGRTGLAISGVEHSVREAVSRIESAEREQVAIASRFEGAVQEARGGQAHIADRLRKVEADAAGPRSAEALRALEQALGRVANHLYEGENRTRQTLMALRERVEKAEAGGSGPTVQAIEDVAHRVGERLSEAETAAAYALENLRASFAGIEGRVDAVETASLPSIDQKLEQIAASLTHQVEAARGELTQTLQTETEGRFDRMERKLSEMADQVRLAEQRSALAIERVGQEVLSVADSLNRRVQSSETRAEESIAQVSGEVSRIAQVVEAKLTRTDTIQAQAMEKLGAEIGRISERLAERIASAERRSAQAIDDVGEQVARVTEKLNQRSERSSDDLVERIRLSEERTAKLLEDARDRIDQRLSETQQQISEQIATPPAPAQNPFESTVSDLGEPEPFPELSHPIEGEERVAPATLMQASGLTTRSGYATPPPLMAVSLPEPSYEPPIIYAPEPYPADTERVTFDAEDFAVAEGFSAFVEAPAEVEPEIHDFDAALDPVAASTVPAVSELQDQDEEPVLFGTAEFERDDSQVEDEHVEPSDVPEEVQPELVAAQDTVEPQPLTTREVIEQARAAARAAVENDGKGRKSKRGKVKAEGGKLASSIFAIFGKRSKRQASSSLQTALVVVGAAAAVSVGAAGFVLMEGRPGGSPPQRVAEALAALTQNSSASKGESDTTPFPATPRVAMALAPTLVPTSAIATVDLSERYTKASDAVAQGRPNAVTELKAVAELGHAPAQFYLAKLYEKGDGGVKKDPVEARRWTERAAEGGDRRAMHNLGMAYVEGTGGAKNSTTAAQWFRRAADLGLVDSQFNLASLYEQGLGVSQNAAEAYKWYLIASKTGDSDARKRAEQVKPQLTIDARALAERAAFAFRATEANPSTAPLATADLGADATSVALAQKALSRLGYYQGPTDGGASPALKMAVAAYQRDQNVTPTGILDPATVQRLSVFTR